MSDRFAEFLETTRPADDDAAPLDEPPAGDRPLPLVPGFRLLTFQFPASSYYTAWKAGSTPTWPEPTEQFVARLRRDYIVRRHELSRGEFDLLTQLAGGSTLNEALSAVATPKGSGVNCEDDSIMADARRN